MSLEYQLNVEIQIVEDDYNEGRISMKERNQRIANLEREARAEEGE